MSKIYCGVNIKNVDPKKKKIGSMQECAKKKQVCLYGLRKIDSKLIEPVKKSESNNKLYKLYGRLMGEKNHLTRKMSGEKNKTNLNELKKQMDDLNNDIAKIKQKLGSIKKMSSRH